MSKRQSLSLNRETLRLLSDDQASGIAGGVTGVWKPTTGPACSGHTAGGQSCVVMPAPTQYKCNQR